MIRDHTPDSDHEPGPLHSLLLQLPWADVFTTNYDTLLERTDTPGRTYQPVTRASDLTTAFPPRIVKLHGSFPSQTPFIISEEDYRRYPSDFAPFVNSVQQSLLENSFVLVGFSGDDPNFLAWTGWIRDELGGRHAPIYLVGSLSLGPAERALLGQRGVTPIDLSPVFEGVHCPKGIHATPLEWFLRNLAAARPVRPERWPWLDQGLDSAAAFDPPLVLGSEAAPEPLDAFPSPQTPLTVETVRRLVARWQFERERYPGWLVAEESKRSTLWEGTKHWIDPLLAFSKDWPAADQVLLFREINWRLETAMVPLFTHWIHAFQSTTDELFPNAANGQPPQPPQGTLPLAGLGQMLDSWLEIAFALLREAREMYNSDRWHALKTQIDRVLVRRPQFIDRDRYEVALWAMWNIDREAAKAAIARWQPSLRSPLAAMWKAGLLAELDDVGEATTLLRAALSEIRKALRSHGRNIELLSLEGWCTYLLFGVETAFDVRRWSSIQSEFSERWEELKAWDCSPWPHKEYFERALSASPPRPFRAEQELHTFDPGQTSVSYSTGHDTIAPYLPAFGCIRLYEQVGIPMHLARINLMGDALMNACDWIAPFVSFCSPALLIRAGKVDSLKKEHFLSRTRVAQMDSALAKQLYDWFLEILERELKTFSGAIVPNSAQESLFEVLPEAMSRVAFKADIEQLRKAFLSALRFHGLPAIRSHIRLHEASKPLFRRLFQAADAPLLLEWLPMLIKAPLFEAHVHPLIPATSVWPDPMERFPAERAREAKDALPNLVAATEEATDWLLRRANSEEGEPRRRAIVRLTYIYLAQLMTATQQQRLGDLLWSRKTAAGLPDVPHFAYFGFLNLPAPDGVDVAAAIKRRILGLPPQAFAIRDAAGRISSLSPGLRHELIAEVSLASKPVMQLRGEAHGTLEWTPEESKRLYASARAWWASDKEAIQVRSFGMDPVSETLGQMGSFLSRAVIPALEADDPAWDELLNWLTEMRGLGTFPTVALPYVLHKRPAQATDVASTIAADLRGDVANAVASAAQAARHWINLAVIGRAPAPPGQLLSGLIDRVIFRRKPGIDSCIANLTFAIVERPQAISPSQANLLAASLVPWHNATVLPVPAEGADEFQENLRPDLRVLLGRLAGALNVLLKRTQPKEAESLALALWRASCASDPLPEVRRAFCAWDQVQMGTPAESQPA